MKQALKLPLPLAFACIHFFHSASSLGGAVDEVKAQVASAMAVIPKDIRGPSAKSFAESSEKAGAWREKITLEYYAKDGLRDPKWDAEALVALKEYAAYGIPRDQKAMDDSMARLDQAIRAVKKAGCTDPLLNYIFVRIARTNDRVNWKTYADEIVPVTDKLVSSKVPCIWRLMACVRSSEAMRKALNERGKISHKNIQHNFMAINELYALLMDPNLQAETFYLASSEMADFFEIYKGLYGETYLAMEPVLLARWPNDARSYLTMGNFYINHAWNARGGEFAGKVTDERWKAFEARLASAEKHLEKAWELDPTDPRIAKYMMSVELGQSKGRDRMELWFQRGMKLRPNSPEFAQCKLTYLEPKWHGSPEEMIEFGRECVANAAWGGLLPLTLVCVHDRLAAYLDTKEEKAGYWKQPEVWPDIKLSYDRYFKDQPKAERHQYILYAYFCEQWDVLHQELKALKNPNHALYGGKEEFDKMSRLASEHTASR